MRMTPKAVAGRKSQNGFTLLELLFATGILLVVSVGLLSLFAVVTARNNENGDQGTKISEFAGDKMEQLMSLNFSDTTSDSTMNPTCISGYGCTPTGPAAVGLKAGGTIDVTDTSKTGYIDYIDSKGNLSTTQPGFGYQRQWKIEDSSATVKTITVRVSIIGNITKFKRVSTLISQKADF